MAVHFERDVLLAAVGDDATDIQDSSEAVSRGCGRRRFVVAGAAVVGLASAAVLWRSTKTCQVDIPTPAFQDNLVTLAEEFPKDLLQLAEVDDDLDARRKWLELASEARAKTQAAMPSGNAVPPEVRDAIDSALSTQDPEKARELVDRAMARAVGSSQAKRKELKSFMKAQRRNLKSKQLSPAKQEAIATCVFDALSATNTVAGIAANLNDAAKTCWGVKAADMFRFGLHGKAWVHTNVCSVNVWAILGGVIGLSGTLASAASDCAATMIPNVGALCAASVSGLVTAVAGVGGASTLVKAACHPKGWYHDIPAGALPSNVGNNEKWIDKHPERKGQYEQEMQQQASMAGARRLDEGPAPARQLLFGGGKGSTATQCSVEIAGAMWSLASAAMAINSAGNLEQGGSCPPKNFLTGSEKPSNSILYRVPQAMCTLDVTSTILGFLAAISYIQLATVNCIDTLSLGAICGSGITGMMAAASGIAKAGSALYVACDVAQKKPIKRIINVGRNVDSATGGMLSDLMGGGMDGVEEVPFGRRLTDDEALMVSIAEDNIMELQKRFATPQEALLSIGIDLEDKAAPWRNGTLPMVNDAAGLMSLLQEPEKVGSLFGGAACQ